MAEGGDTEEKKIRFAVRSLGWVRIAEEDLTPERSSKAVNKCIVNLSLGRNDLNDVVGRWGDVSLIRVFVKQWQFREGVMEPNKNFSTMSVHDSKLPKLCICIQENKHIIFLSM